MLQTVANGLPETVAHVVSYLGAHGAPALFSSLQAVDRHGLSFDHDSGVFGGKFTVKLNASAKTELRLPAKRFAAAGATVTFTPSTAVKSAAAVTGGVSIEFAPEADGTEVEVRVAAGRNGSITVNDKVVGGAPAASSAAGGAAKAPTSSLASEDERISQLLESTPLPCSHKLLILHLQASRGG